MSGNMLVVGASGLIGRAVLERMSDAPGWTVTGISRRLPDGVPGAELRSVDLLDTDACARFAATASDVTHVVYAALSEDPGLFGGWTDDATIERNSAMLRNIFDPLSDVATGLRHVCLLHGTKAYGVHHPDLGFDGVHMPLKERWPVRPHRNFYFEQENHLAQRRAATGGTWATTVFRPTFVYGEAEGNNMNPLVAIAAYASILRELGEPLHFPGRDPDHLREAVDAGLVADAIGWAADAEAARDETFNLTNGDVFTWAGVWPAIARACSMEVGEHRPTMLAEWLVEHAPTWERVVSGHGLSVSSDVTTFVGANSMVYADLVLGSLDPPTSEGGPPPVIVNSTIKGRHAGFETCVDTEDMFVNLIGRLQDRGRIPGP